MRDVRALSVDEVRPMRHAVLRKGQDFSTTLYAEDAREDAEHFGAFVSDSDSIAAIASVYLESREGGPTPAWRLRGMASREDLRAKGYGSKVLRGVIAAARAKGLVEIWCNAREVAFDFYQSHGFELIGGIFEMPDIGPHSVMRITL